MRACMWVGGGAVYVCSCGDLNNFFMGLFYYNIRKIYSSMQIINNNSLITV